MSAGKLSAQTAITSLVSTDILYVVSDPGGTPVSKKITLANLFQNAQPILVGGTTPSIDLASGQTNTGYFKVAGKTSGSLKITCADAAGQAVTLNLSAQTVGAATLTIPDFAGVSDTLVFKTLADTLSNKTLAAPIMTGKTRMGIIASPVAATGAGGGVGGAAALGSANHLYVSSDGATKGVKMLTGVAGDWHVIINTSGTACNLFAASGGTINGGSANAGCAIPASKGVLAFCSAADTWMVFDLTAHSGAAA
jgi:hypothetical protein